MKGNTEKAVASVLFFHMGDPYWTTLAQETVDLDEASSGYGEFHLLKHDVNWGRFNLSSQAERSATSVQDPTPENLAHVLQSLADRGLKIDLFIMAHGTRGGLTASAGEPHHSQLVRAESLRRILPKKLPLRLVWQMNCYGASLNQLWVDLGAEAATGPVDVNFFPTQWGSFIRRWNEGRSLEECVARTATILRQVPVFAYLQAQALMKGYSNILGAGPDVDRYFREEWGITVQTGAPRQARNGREVMKTASRYHIEGNGEISRYP